MCQCVRRIDPWVDVPASCTGFVAYCVRVFVIFPDNERSTAVITKDGKKGETFVVVWLSNVWGE